MVSHTFPYFDPCLRRRIVVLGEDSDHVPELSDVAREAMKAEIGALFMAKIDQIRDLQRLGVVMHGLEPRPDELDVLRRPISDAIENLRLAEGGESNPNIVLGAHCQ